MSTARRKRKPRRTSRQLRHEPLEFRQLLAGDLVISELLARNDNTLNDEDGESSDWLELHNPGDAAISTDGWYLTDEASNLTKWQLPAVDVGAGGYLLVFASGKDRAVAGAPLHASFQLSGGGEYLALVMPDGLTVADDFVPAFPAQAVDVSYGVDEGNLAQTWYFAVPTPGAANELSRTFEGIVADTQFSVDRGFFDAPLDVEISTLTAGAEIRYTLDGSTPNGRSRLYTGPITINTTSALRAVATKDNFLPTNVDTQTYIFLEDVVRQPDRPAGFPTTWGGAPAVDYGMDPEIVDAPAYQQDLLDGLRAIPTLSVVLNTGDMFGSSGLYSNTTNNSLEKPASAELILPDGSTGFQIDAGLKIQGGASRQPNNSPKHSMSLRFRDIYGPGMLDYPLFEDSPVNSFDGIHLRAMYNNSWIHWSDSQRPRGTMIRDQWMRDSLLDMGQIDAGRGSYVHLYINGLYWGVYNIHERPEASHYSEYFGGSEQDYDATNGGSVVDGDLTSYNAMKNVLARGDWAAIQQVLDVDNYIDFTIIQRFASNNDLKQDGNWRAAGGGPNNAPWRFYSWDGERVLEGVNEGGPGGTADPPGILNDLLAIPEFVLRFGDRIQKHFFNGGALTPEAAAARWQNRVDELQLAIVAESARWGDYRRDVHQRNCGCDLYARDSHWLPEQQRLMNTYFPFRSDIVVGQYRSLGLFPNQAAPQFNQHGGNVPAGFEVSLSGTGTIYYTLDGSDPLGGEITVDQTTLLPEFAPATALVPMDGSLGDAWRMPGFDDSAWASGPGGVGYERTLGYETLIGIDVEAAMFGNNATAYMRVPFNVDDPSTFDTLTLRMKYDDGFVAYLNGERVAGRNDPALLGWNAGATSSHSDSSAVVFEDIDITEFLHLLQPGENLLAIHGLNAGASSSDFLILPEVLGGIASGSELSPGAIEFVAPFALNTSTTVRARATNRRQWSPLVEATFIVDSPPVRISELMYHPADPLPGSVYVNGDFEYIELVNIGAGTIDLSNLRLSDGVQFDFAGAAINSLDPGAYVLLVSNQQAFESRYGAGRPIAGQFTGQLSNGGERIKLEDNFGTSILDFAYDDAWFPETDGGGHSLVIVDLEADPAVWNLQASWRASHLPGGSPGAADVDRLPGDANGDGRVNIDDLNAVRNNFGNVGVGVEGDTNGDGVVNIDDLNAVRNNFGAMAAPVALQATGTLRATLVDRFVASRPAEINEPALRRSRFAAIRGAELHSALREQRLSFTRLPRSSRGHLPTANARANVWDQALLQLAGERFF